MLDTVDLAKFIAHYWTESENSAALLRDLDKTAREFHTTRDAFKRQQSILDSQLSRGNCEVESPDSPRGSNIQTSNDAMAEALAIMESRCGMQYKGTREEKEHEKRFYCMRAFLAQCMIKQPTKTGAAQGQRSISRELQYLERVRSLVPNCPHVQ